MRKLFLGKSYIFSVCFFFLMALVRFKTRN